MSRWIEPPALWAVIIYMAFIGVHRSQSGLGVLYKQKDSYHSCHLWIWFAIADINPIATNPSISENCADPDWSLIPLHVLVIEPQAVIISHE
jgi:hypothetical protein